MAESINEILPDALRSPQAMASPALRPQWAEMPIDSAWALFQQQAQATCPGYNIRPTHSQTIYDIFLWCMCREDGPYDPAKGLWLCGNIGTGKSTLLAIIRDFCRQCRMPSPDGWPYGFLCVSAPQVCSQYQANGVEALAPYCASDRLAIDDLGAEIIPISHYGDSLNVFQYILQARYDRRHSSFTHVTTNLAPEQVAEAYGERIADRCLEMFNTVTLLGASHRSANRRKEAAL